MSPSTSLPGGLHGPVQVRRVLGQVAGDAALGGGDDKIGMGRRRQGDDMEAGLVEGLHHGQQLGRPVAGAGAGDQKDQRRLLLLVGKGDSAAPRRKRR